MNQILQQALTILTTPPGNLVYHIVVAFLTAIVLQAALGTWRATGLDQGGRMAAGVFLLLLARLVLIVSAMVAGQDLTVPDVLFPILDRAVTAFSLIVILWLWSFPKSVRLADAASLLLVLLTLTLSIFTFIYWSNQGLEAFFNTTLLDTLWEAYSLVLMLLGVVILFARQPTGWSVGVVMLALLAVGHSAHLLVPLPDSDYPGAVRLLQLIAYPLLFFLPQRFTVPPAPAKHQPAAVVPDRRRYNVGPQVFESFLSLANETDRQKICQAIVRTISEALLADISLLVAPPAEGGDMAIECGYDLIREEYRDGGYLSKAQAPMLATALQRGRALRLPANSSSEDLAGLSEALQLSRSGPLLAVPIFGPAGEIILGVVLLSPYSNRSWTPEDQNYLLGISKPLGDVILRVHSGAAAGELQRDEDHDHFMEELESLREQSLQDRERAETLAQVITSHEDVQETLAELRAENERLQQEIEEAQSGGTAAPKEVEQLQGELRMALEEVAYMRNALAEADEKISALEQAGPAAAGSTPGDSVEVITSIAQELRQPMSSIIGYTDLLLSESTGILGALQRKFIERIKVSTERLGALMEDLIQITTLDEGVLELAPERVELAALIQETVDQMQSQIEAKDLDFKLDRPERLPPVQADRDALQQALLHLLQNAVAATPEEGAVSLRVRVENAEDKQDYVLVQVTDQGGGIPPEDLPRVFSRLYRADNVLIQGVGDTGVGLSIVKQLIEAHGGRIWVDSDLGHGSIFSVLLPVNEAVLPSDGRIDGRGDSGA